MNAFKRRLILLTATLWTGLCLALPAPHDIEQAVARGQLAQAEQMLREVIAEKPASAKAHYELAQVLAREGHHSQALQAINRARTLDPSLRFAQSPDKFNAIAQAIEQQARPSTVSTLPPSSPAAAPSTSAVTPTTANWFWPALLSGGFALLVLALWRRMQARGPGLSPQPAGLMGRDSQPGGFGAVYDPRGNVPPYGNGSVGTPYGATAPGGSGMAGAVVGGLAGVAAGYALSKALEDHDRPVSPNTHVVSPSSDAIDDMGVVRMDNASSDLGRFDAGTGDGWDTPADDSDTW